MAFLPVILMGDNSCTSSSSKGATTMLYTVTAVSCKTSCAQPRLAIAKLITITITIIIK
jgi:hypothetical protein